MLEISWQKKQACIRKMSIWYDLYVMGAYNTSKGRIWIITNRISEIAGDNATTVCFPEER